MYRLNCTIKGSDMFVAGHRIHLNPVREIDLDQDLLDKPASKRYNRYVNKGGRKIEKRTANMSEIEEARGTNTETWVKVNGAWWLVQSPDMQAGAEKNKPSKEATKLDLSICYDLDLSGVE